jgi:hypothetical protein
MAFPFQMGPGGSSGIVLPWEVGFLGLVMGPRRGRPGEAVPPMPFARGYPLQWVGPVPPLPPQPAATVAAAAAMTTRASPPAAAAVCRKARCMRPRASDIKDLLPTDADGSRRVAALAKWRLLLTAADQSSSLRRQMDAEDDPGAREDMFAHAVRERTPNTLMKRAGHACCI